VRAQGLELDLFAEEAPVAFFAHVESTLSSIDNLVNNATHCMRDGIANLTAGQLNQHYTVSVRAMALLLAEFVKRYRVHQPNGHVGCVINLSLGQGLGPMPGELAYGMTKGAVEAFTVR